MMDNAGKVKVKMKPVDQILKDKGLAANGDVQRFHTQNVLRRIQKYMPFRSGATIKLMFAQTGISSAEVVLDVPYGKYLYYGKVMVGSPPKVVTDRDLQYTKDKNPQAGPFWDRALVAAEKAVLQRELQAYIDRKAEKR